MKVGDIVCASHNFDPDQRLGLVLEIIDDEVIMKFDKRLGEASQYYDTESE